MRARFVNEAIKHLRYHTPEELSKLPEPPELYDTLTPEQKEWFDTIVNNRAEIRRLYNNKYYRNGGWNGMMDAINAYQEKEGITTPEFDGVDIYELLMNEL